MITSSGWGIIVCFNCSFCCCKNSLSSNCGSLSISQGSFKKSLCGISVCLGFVSKSSGFGLELNGILLVLLPCDLVEFILLFLKSGFGLAESLLGFSEHFTECFWVSGE